MGLFSRSLKKTRRSSPSRRRRLLWGEALEDRRLLAANLNLFPATGIVVYGGSGVNNSLTISYNAGTDTYTFTDSAEVINLDPDIQSTASHTGSGTNTVTFVGAEVDAVAAGGSLTLFRIQGNLGDDAVTIDSFRAGAEGIDVRNNAGQGTDSVVVNGDIGSLANPVQNTVSLVAETVDLGADIWTDNQAVRLEGAIALLADSAISSSANAVTLDGSVDGAAALSIASDGLVDITGVVGGTTALASLDLTGDTVRLQDDVTTGAGDLSLTADNHIFLAGVTLNGTGDLTIAPKTAGADIDFLATDALFNAVIQPGFGSVTLGSATTGTLRVLQDGTTASLTVGSDLRLIASAVEVRDGIDQETYLLTITSDALLFQGKGAGLGTGDVTFEKLTAGGTLVVTGDVGGRRQDWGTNNLVVAASGADVSFNNAVGDRFASIEMTADNIVFNDPSAVTSQGDILFTTTSVTLNGGVFSGGGIAVNGDLTLSRDALFRVAGGSNLTVNGTTTANGNNIVVRGVGGPIANVAWGDVNGAGEFKIDSANANTAVNVTLQDLTATEILVRGVDITLDSTLEATNGNLHLLGAVTLSGDTSLLNSSGVANSFVRVDGTIDGAFALIVDAGLGNAAFSQSMGSIDPLASLMVSTGKASTLTKSVAVIGDFHWSACNGGDNSLTINADVTTVSGTLTVTAAAFTNNTGVVFVFVPCP